MLYPFFRQHARHGDDAVPVGVGLDDRHEGGGPAVFFRLCLRFSRWTVMMALLKAAGTSTLKRFAGEKTGTRILDGKRAANIPAVELLG